MGGGSSARWQAIYHEECLVGIGGPGLDPSGRRQSACRWRVVTRLAAAWVGRDRSGRSNAEGPTLRGLSPLVGAAVDGQSRGVDGGATTWITQPPERMPS
jgi:hypothetical protein